MRTSITAILCLLAILSACTSKESSTPAATDGLLLFANRCDSSAVPAPIDRNGYPLIAGMNIGEADYDDACYQANIARLDLVILGFYGGWHGGTDSIRAVVQSLKAMNPRIRVGQYSILTEQYDRANPATDEIRAKLDAMDWWVLDSAGHKVQWTTLFHAWEVNVTAYAQADGDGYRFPEWLARWAYDNFFSPVPEFDIWYFDNVFPGPRVTADYNLDTFNDDPEDPPARQAYRAGVASEWAAARSLESTITCIGNVTDISSAEYSMQLDGGFCEALIGKTWSIESTGTWNAMMDYYRSVRANVKDSTLTIFNIHGAVNDYAVMRYGLASCLLECGHYAYTDINAGYCSVPWFDEFNISLGQPVDDPPTAAWQNGVYRRRYENGMAIVNPKGNGTAAVTVEDGYRRISGTQDPSVNNGQPATTITLGERDGIILLKL